MSVTFSTRCETCGVSGPELGDHGMMGIPSASTLHNVNGRAPKTFGYIYEGFRAIALVTVEIDAYLRFLRAHRDHHIQLFGDEMKESDLSQWRASSWPMDQEPPAPPEGSAHYVDAFYGVLCPTCGLGYASDRTEVLRRFEPTDLEPDAIDRFDAQAFAAVDAEIYRCAPLYPHEEIWDLLFFLQRHRDHKPRAQLLASKAAKAAFLPRPERVGAAAKGTARRFERVAGTSHRYWRIWMTGSQVNTHFGALHKSGQVRSTLLQSPGVAETALEDAVAKKVTEGYCEVPDE